VRATIGGESLCCSTQRYEKPKLQNGGDKAADAVDHWEKRVADVRDGGEHVGDALLADPGEHVAAALAEVHGAEDKRAQGRDVSRAVFTQSTATLGTSLPGGGASAS
jgi:hypothetical protein